VAIGGINFDNMSRVFSLGYETIALSDGIFLKNDLKKIVKFLSL
jgi:thiamine monophosphate synthase